MIIYFLLGIPLILLAGTMARHMLGIKMMSLSILVMIVYILAFVIEGNTPASIIFGSILLLFTYFFAYFIKKLTANTGLHHFARIAFVMSLVSIFTLLLIVIIGKYSGFDLKPYLSAMNPFALILGIVLAEQFSSSQIQKGLKTSRTLFINTLILSIFLALFVSTAAFQAFVFEFPYITLIALVLSFALGKYQAMRLNERMRFKSIAAESLREEKND